MSCITLTRIKCDHKTAKQHAITNIVTNETFIAEYCRKCGKIKKQGWKQFRRRKLK